MIDHENLRKLANQLPTYVAVSTFPEEGEAAIKAVLRICAQVFKAIDPSQLGGPVVVFSQAHTSSGANRSRARRLFSINQVQEFVETGFMLEVDISTKELWLWQGQPPVDVQEIRANGVVFLHEGGTEKYLIADKEISLEKVFPGKQSIYSPPNYANLNQALAYYQTRVVRQSDCPILKHIWYDEKKLFLKEKPEDTIQQSLAKFLRFTLRDDAEVMREQNVDTSHPVDIRVTFQFTNRVALIEVKWLGRSKHSNGSPATSYTTVRAVHGARQLAEYLDSFAISSPTSAVVGHLIILDARRRMLSHNDESISTENGMFYADKDITFEPRYDVERKDFEQPLRMFAEPICS